MSAARPPRGDAGNIVGNVYDKYGTGNPIARRLMRGFLDAVTELYRQVGPRTVLEVGCGEGRLADTLVRSGPRPERFVACDLELDGVREGLDPQIEFQPASIYELPYEDGAFDLVVCCEVLEHLEDPPTGMAELARVARRGVLLSVPWEPVWSVLNLARGRYLLDLGNTPGHVQRFSRGAILRLVEPHLQVTTLRRPLPWTVILGRPRPPDAR